MTSVNHQTTPAIGLNALSIYILYRLYVDYVNDYSGPINIEYICKTYFTKPSRNLTKTAIDRFRGSRYGDSFFIGRSGTAAAGYNYENTSKGIEAVEQALRTNDSLMRHIAKQGEEALLEHYTVDVSGIDNVTDLEEPNLEEPENWASISVDTNSPSVNDAIDAVEKLVIEIRISNIFADQFPGQSEAVIDTLRGGVERLKEGDASRMHVFLMLQKPLAWLSEKFLGTMLGELAKKAGGAVAKLLGM